MTETENEITLHFLSQKHSLLIKAINTFTATITNLLFLFGRQFTLAKNEL